MGGPKTVAINRWQFWGTTVISCHASLKTKNKKPFAISPTFRQCNNAISIICDHSGHHLSPKTTINTPQISAFSLQWNSNYLSGTCWGLGTATPPPILPGPLCSIETLEKETICNGVKDLLNFCSHTISTYHKDTVIPFFLLYDIVLWSLTYIASLTFLVYSSSWFTTLCRSFLLPCLQILEWIWGFEIAEIIKDWKCWKLYCFKSSFIYKIHAKIRWENMCSIK